MIDINKLDNLMIKLEECYDEDKQEINKEKFLEILNKNITKVLGDIEYYQNKLKKLNSKLTESDKDYIIEIKKNKIRLNKVIANLDNLEGEDIIKAENSIVYLNEKIRNIMKKHSKIRELYDLKNELQKNKELYKLYNFYIKKIEKMADK